jgi:hypothetical protein
MAALLPQAPEALGHDVHRRPPEPYHKDSRVNPGENNGMPTG